MSKNAEESVTSESEQNKHDENANEAKGGQIEEFVSREKLAELIDDVRERIKKNHQDALSSVFDARDVARLLGTQWARGFLFETDADVAAAVVRLEATLRWRHDFRMNDIDESTLPEEVLKDAVQYARHKARDGSPVFWFHTSHGDPAKAFAKENTELTRQYAAWSLDMVVRRCPTAQLTVVCDVSQGAPKPSLRAIDHLRWWVKVGAAHFPNLIRRVLIVGLPSALVGLMKMMLLLVPSRYRNRISYVSADKVVDFIDPAFLPRHLGGTNTDVGTYVPWSEAAEGTVALVPY